MKTPLSEFTLREIERELKVRGQRLDKEYPKVKKELEKEIDEWKERNPIFVESLLKFISFEKLIDQEFNSIKNYCDECAETYSEQAATYELEDEDYFESVEDTRLKKVEFREPGYDDMFTNYLCKYESVSQYIGRMWDRWCLVEHKDAVYHGD